jgi:hypothetical protein
MLSPLGHKKAECFQKFSPLGHKKGVCFHAWGNKGLLILDAWEHKNVVTLANDLPGSPYFHVRAPAQNKSSNNACDMHELLFSPLGYKILSVLTPGELKRLSILTPGNIKKHSLWQAIAIIVRQLLDALQGN